VTDDHLNELAIAELACGGEPAYHLAQAATFLRLAEILLDVPYHFCKSALWWRLRANLIHQQVLDEPALFPAELVESLQSRRDMYAPESEPELLGRFYLEIGLMHHIVLQEKVAAEYFIKAARATGLEYELTGALGKRTKFQQTELSQLVLLAQSHLKISDEENDVESSSSSEKNSQVPSDPAPQVPETLLLNDDTLLEQTAFTSSNPGSQNSGLTHLDPASQPALHPLDQCNLLSLCLNVKNTSPVHGLTSEQMSPYVSRVISHPRNWSVHTMALLLRSRLESTRTRTVERSTLQLQALVDQMPTADSAVSERLLYFHDIPLPSKWDLERELAERFLTLGVVRSALEIFERLEMFEEVVKCWVSMERPEKGITIVRDLLEGRKVESEVVTQRGKAMAESRKSVLDVSREAKLWCILGDLEPDHSVEHYERAWSVSKNTSGRAMRSLGGFYFARGEFSKAMTCLQKAVLINPLLSRSWFILGCAAVRLEDWEEGKRAFTRCVSIDEEDGESWNNLASMYLRMDSTKEKRVDREDENEVQIEFFRHVASVLTSVPGPEPREPRD
jgi:tetratricopeptide (TPR) repeat protein